MLPRYCIHTPHLRDKVPGGNDPEQRKRWSSVMGETFIHMHHYCYGLMDFNRATLLAREPHVRKFYLQNAINEFDYVLARAPQSFVLLPEILAKKGETLIRQGRGALAVEPLERAMELRPDYWPPYAHLSDYYKDAGDPKLARQVLERGLSNSPDAKGLQRRLAELDAGPGKPKSSPSPDRKQGTAPGQ
jgi:tetratricopeptide (TPR) repeat protein